MTTPENYKISDALLAITPTNVFVEAYINAATDSVYSCGTPDENLIVEWHCLHQEGRVDVPPPRPLPDWFKTVEEEEAA